jgi:periplasmic divalent cation tolerance protein
MMGCRRVLPVCREHRKVDGMGNTSDISILPLAPSSATAKPDDTLGVVLITVPAGHSGDTSSIPLAQTLASALVEQQLCACVNIVPLIQSIYRWQGTIHNDAESLLVVKTRQDKLNDIAQWLKAHHPYEVPELIFMPVTAGATSYLEWWRGSMAPVL